MTRWLSAEQQAMWRAWLEVVALLDDRLNRDLAVEWDLTLPEYEIMVRLSETPTHSLRMSELAEQVVHSRSRLTHTVARMQARGLLERRPCASDGRGVEAVLTDAGMDLLVQAAPSHVLSVRRNLIDQLDCDDIADLARALGKVRCALRSEGTARVPAATS